MSRTPIAIFLYNRPDHARQLFDSLLKCSRLEECKVYVFCDGAKNPQHANTVQAAREVVHEYSSSLKAEVFEREQNLGLAHSIVNGVTELCKQYGRAIVLEDDFILHPFFLDFMLQSLDRYADDERVAQVAGFTFPIDTPEKPDAFFLPLTTSWGWATWQRGWNLFSWDTGSALESLNADPQLQARFNLHGAYPYADMMRLTAEGKMDSWAIRWYWHTFLANKLTLYPHRSLVWQNGFDLAATNTTGLWSGLQKQVNEFLAESWSNPLLFPEIVQTDETAFQKLENFLRRKRSYSLMAHLPGTLKRKLTRLVKKGPR